MRKIIYFFTFIHWCLLLTLVLISALGIQGLAQSENIRFRNFNIEEGLAGNIALCIVQDQDGFMWIGTSDGLNKYDGYNFTTYQYDPQDSFSLSSSRINDILVDNDNGNLWLATANGLNYYQKDENQFIEYDPPAFEIRNVACLTKDRNGRLWLGTADGLFQFDTRRKVFVKCGSIQGKPYNFLEKNVSEISLGKNGSLWICTHEGLYILENGSISSASIKGGHPILSSVEFIRDVLIDTTGDHWIATESLENGVYRFDSTLTFINCYSNIEGNNESLPNNKVRVFSQLSDGRIWFGTYGGLSLFNAENETFQNYQSNKYNPNSLSNNSIQEIFEDRDGGVWIATYNGGINYFHPSSQKFNHIMELWEENSLSNNQVWGFAQDNRENVWIGTENGLNFMDASTGSIKHFYKEKSDIELLDNTIKTLAFDKNNNLWIGNLLGLSFFNLSTKQLIHYVHDPLNETSIGYGHVQAICEDRNGQIWIGTHASGLNKINLHDNSFDRFGQIENEPEGVVDNRINNIIEYKNGLLWVATELGLELFNTKTGFYTRQKLIDDGIFESISGVNILTLYQDGSENLWIGTKGKGLLIYNTDTGEICSVDNQTGIANNTVNGILEDNDGNFWVSTNRGISKLIRPNIGWDTIDKKHIVNFKSSDGLQGMQFNPNSAFKSRDGQLYFGGTNGFNSFYADQVNKTIFQPKVVFTDIKFRNDITSKSEKSLKSKVNYLKDSIKIDYSQSDFSIEFAALNYRDPEHTLYEYMLEPLDEGWNPIGNERAVNYSNLPSGVYLFKVRATNNFQEWGESYSQKSITILPPIWLAWWAYVIYSVIISGLLYLFFTIASRWGKLKSDLLYEHREREKEQELNQLRIKFFTDISHELRTPLTLILSPLERLVNQYVGSAKLKNQLLMIQRSGERMLQLINQLLDLRKLETGHLQLKAGYGDMVKFVREVTLAFRELALHKNINYQVQSEADKINIWFDRDKFEVILYNLLSNAIKYTPNGGNIGIGLSVHLPGREKDMSKNVLFREGYAEITVEDDGKGIPAESLPKIFDRFYQSGQDNKEPIYGSGVGLEIVKKFVELHKGTITVNSIEANAGQPGKTKFIIKLPIGRKHLAISEIIQDFKTSEDITLYKRASLEHDASLLDDSENASSTEEMESSVSENATILVVEDNDEVRKFIVSLFESEYVIIEASNGDQGIEKALDKVPDLVISDIMMPGTDGLELCKMIKSDPRTSHVPVILLTARTAVTFQIEGMEIGADDYITKPFSANLLQIRVHKLIEQRNQLRKQFGKGPGLIPEEISITSVDEKLIAKAVGYINDHISDPDLGVEKVAGEVGLSRVHFYRKIKALTNMSAVEFIRLIRLERAAQLLKTGKLNISEVRYAVGFQDADYFRKMFKEHYGLSPSDYAEASPPSKYTENTDL